MKQKIPKVISLILLILMIGRWFHYYLENYYGENWDQVSNLVILLVILTWTVFVFNKVKSYQKGIYLWNKLLGMDEAHIFKDFMRKNIGPCLMLVITILCFGSFSGVWNGILFCFDISLFFFRSGYNGNRTGKFVILGAALWGIVFDIIVIRSVMCSSSVHEVISLISSSFIVRYAVYCFTSSGILPMVLGLITAALLVYTFPIYDERVCRNSMFYLKKWSGINALRKRNGFLDGFPGRQLSYFFCNIMYGLCFAVLYISYIFLTVNISDKEEAFSILTVVLSIMIGGCIDSVFHVDSYHRQWYKALGETYHGFFSKKLIIEYLLQLPVIGIFIICSWMSRYAWQSAFFVLGYSLLYGLGVVLYFSSYYIDMREHYVKFELVKMCFVMLLIINPVTNLLICPYWYKKGKRRWSVYVGDSQFDKTV